MKAEDEGHGSRNLSITEPKLRKAVIRRSQNRIGERERGGGRERRGQQAEGEQRTLNVSEDETFRSGAQ